MLKVKATRNQGGVVICGTGEDLEELYCALNALMEKCDGLEDGEVPQSGTNLRISSLCYDIRHALPVPTNIQAKATDKPGPLPGPAGDAGKILSFETGKELPFDLSLDGEDGADDELEELEELEEFEGIDDFNEDFIDTGILDETYDDADDAEGTEGAEALEARDGEDEQALMSPGEAGVHYDYGNQTGLPLQAVCEFRILWPEVIFVSLLLREYLGTRYDLAYGKKLKGLDWTLDWVVVRRFQVVVLDCLCQYVSPAQAKSIRKIFLESYSHLSGYCTQYIDKLTNTFARKNAAQRLRMLSQLPRKIIAQGSDYRAMEAEIRVTAKEYGCPPWELSLVEEIPEDFVW